MERNTGCSTGGLLKRLWSPKEPFYGFVLRVQPGVMLLNHFTYFILIFDVRFLIGFLPFFQEAWVKNILNQFNQGFSARHTYRLNFFNFHCLLHTE